MREPRNRERKEKSWLETLWGDEELLTGKRKITPAQVMLLFRNAMALLAAMLFLLSLGSDRYPAIRAAGYLFGAVAYVCEIMVMTDCFRIRLPRGELFMPYCFGPLYLIMGVGYLVGWDEMLTGKSVGRLMNANTIYEGRVIVLPAK